MSWDGKIYDKYRVEHTDGTPLHGKKYFVLRLDSDDPVEAARVAAAMRAYKNEPRNCDALSAQEQTEKFNQFCQSHRNSDLPKCAGCPLEDIPDGTGCAQAWGQMPYESEAAK